MMIMMMICGCVVVILGLVLQVLLLVPNRLFSGPFVLLSLQTGFLFDIYEKAVSGFAFKIFSALPTFPSQCSNADNEPMVALVVGGRHPGHYFLDSDDFNDVVTRLVACVIFCHQVGYLC